MLLFLSVETSGDWDKGSVMTLCRCQGNKTVPINDHVILRYRKVIKSQNELEIGSSQCFFIFQVSYSYNFKAGTLLVMISLMANCFTWIKRRREPWK